MIRKNVECDAMTGALLDAAPEELEGRGETDLARHLESCPSCRGIADRILAETAALNRWLERPGALDVDAILARARLEASARPTVGRRFREARWVLPLTAAAALAVLYLAERPPPPRGTPEPSRVAMTEPTLDLEVVGNATAAVLETDNPNITVVWLMQGGVP
jgi:predicted anti-sigma-YlaC factor YlaD